MFAHVRAQANASRAAPAGPTAIVVAGEEETRVLLRGLLRLHHFRVVGEAEGSTLADQLVGVHQPTLLLADAHLNEGSLNGLIRAARTVAPRTRIVVVCPSSRTPAFEAGATPDATLPRPFRIQEFAHAVGGEPRPPS